MKRYASHYLFLPGCGYLKQYVAETEAGEVVSVFPLAEEIEGVEWHPGVIALLTETENAVSGNPFDIFQTSDEVLEELPEVFRGRRFPSGVMPYLFYPFDFTAMRPVGGTRHRLLR